MHHSTHRTMVAILALAFFPGKGASAQRPAAHSATGAVHFGVSCSPEAGAEFDRGVTLLHHMTYPRARESFERVAALDPACAMAHWGIAMTLFQPLWPTRPGPADLDRGWKEIGTVRSIGRVTERERLLVDAAAAFFEHPDSTDYWARIRRWEQGMERAWRAFPNDDDVATLYALAHLAVAPTDSGARAYSDSAAGILLAVLRRHPGHPGAEHYLVHANDAPGREHQSLEVVREYETIAPENPHALHMPTHIYVRLGDWDAAVRGNLRSAAAALRFPAGAHGELVWDEFPHAMEYLIYALLQQGADDEAGGQLRRLQETRQLQPSFKTAFHLASTRARYALERHAWVEAMALPVREPSSLEWDRFPWAEAVSWFARGLGAAHQSRPAVADSAGARLGVLEARADSSGEQLFARNIRILRLELAAWQAGAAGRRDSSVGLMEQAAALERSTPKPAVTPGPTIPAEELLGDLLLMQSRPHEALAAYERSLALYPRRFNSLLGAVRAARRAGDEAATHARSRELIAVAGSGRRAALAEARR